MLILTIRTDKPESEIGLFEDLNQLTYLEWHAHLELAETIHTKVSTLLKDIQKTLTKQNYMIGVGFGIILVCGYFLKNSIKIDIPNVEHKEQVAMLTPRSLSDMIERKK